MEISREEVEKVARLARLALTDEEAGVYQKQLSSILGYINQLGEVNTKNVPATAQVTGSVNTLADDRASNPKQKDLPVDVPVREGTSIKVKGVFDG